MEQDKKNKLLLAATVIGFAYWIIVFFSIFVLSEFLNHVKEEGVKRLLPGVLFSAVSIAPCILNLIGWKRNSKKIVIAAIILYFLTGNALSPLLCVIGILWDSNNTLGLQERKKNTLLVVAGIMGILGVVCWFVPYISRIDGSGSYSWVSVLLSFVMDSSDISRVTFFMNVMALYYFIALLASFIIAIAICLFGKLRNNSKKVLIAAITYIISLSFPSAVMCFIAYARMKKQEAK